jgi:hypothetical protein
MRQMEGDRQWEGSGHASVSSHEISICAWLISAVNLFEERLWEHSIQAAETLFHSALSIIRSSSWFIYGSRSKFKRATLLSTAALATAGASQRHTRLSKGFGTI